MPAPVSPGENRLRWKLRKWPHGMRLTKHGLIDSDRTLKYIPTTRYFCIRYTVYETITFKPSSEKWTM